MTTSNIAGAINDAHANVEKAKQQAVALAIECGRLLEQAKATVPHGGWKLWLAEHCTFSERTAQLYMKVARHVGDDPAKAQRVADLSLRELAVLMAKPSRDEQDAEAMMEAWHGADGAARIKFAFQLFERGDSDQRTYRTICAKSGLTVEVADRNTAALIARFVPPERHAEVAGLLREGGHPEVADHMAAGNR